MQNDDAVETARLAAYEEQVERFVESYHELAKQTKNPLYAWRAVEVRGWVWQMKQKAGVAQGALQVPAWCSEYFAKAATNIIALADGNDIRLDPVSGEAIVIPCGQPDIANGKAVDLIPLALGFVTGTPGHNAIRAARTDTEDLRIADRYQELRMTLLTPTKAREVLAAEFGAAEDSVIRKRVTRGRRLSKGQLPESWQGKK